MFKYIVLLIVSLGLVACDDSATQQVPVVSVQEAYQALNQGQAGTSFLFLDVRTPEEYQSGHVPTAKNIPIQVLSQRLAEVPKDVKVFVYCESGVRSTKAAKILHDAGYTNIVNMKASMRGWRHAGLKVER